MKITIFVKMLKTSERNKKNVQTKKNKKCKLKSTTKKKGN
jgi:hypothetical protein